MDQMPPEEKKFQRVLTDCRAMVGYQPQTDEVDYTKYPQLNSLLVDRLILPTSKDSDPYQWAKLAIDHLAGQVVCVLVPGRCFDHRGTRQGRGLGWYDRWLATVPPYWLRVGVLGIKQFSPSPLLRQAWDEPVDWLMIYDESSGVWSVVETAARYL